MVVDSSHLNFHLKLSLYPPTCAAFPKAVSTSPAWSPKAQVFPAHASPPYVPHELPWDEFHGSANCPHLHIFQMCLYHFVFCLSTHDCLFKIFLFSFEQVRGAFKRSPYKSNDSRFGNQCRLQTGRVFFPQIAREQLRCNKSPRSVSVCLCSPSVPRAV